MSLLRNALKLNRLTATGEANQSFRSLLLHSPRSFSTEAPPPDQASVHIDRILQSTNSGVVYGRFGGGTKYVLKNTLKTDIIRLFDGSNLGPDDIKVMYSPDFQPINMLFKFPSTGAYEYAMKTLVKMRDGHRLIMTDRQEWDHVYSHGGQSLLMEGIPRNAFLEDVERFLSGCDYDARSMNLFFLPVNGVAQRMALVRFPSPTLAMTAYINKNKGFCLNNEINVRVLQ